MDRQLLVALVVGALLGACAAPAATPAAATATTAPPPATRPAARGAAAGAGDDDPARAYELGAGVPRDYAAAAKIHEERCAGGRGDVVACRKLGWAIAAARGVAFDRRRALELLGQACRRRDWLACPAFPMALDKEGFAAMRAACERGVVGACDVELALPSGDGGAAQERRQDLTDRSCRHGSLTGCLEVVEGVAMQCGDDMDAACVARLYALASELRTWEALYARLDGCRPGRSATPACRELDQLADAYASVEAIVHAVGRLRGWCDQGDADACAALPGRAIAAVELCEAADYRACARAAFDDEGAGEQACEHGVEDGCVAVASIARDVDPVDLARAQDFFARGCKLGSHDACTAAQDPELATGCAGYTPSRHPATSRPVAPAVRGTAVGGRPVALGTVKLDHVVVPHNGRPWELYAELAELLGPAVRVFVMVDQLDGAPDVPGVVVFARRDDDPGDDVRFHGGVPDFSPFVVDARGRIRARLGTPRDIWPQSLARCVKSLLAEP